ncbi:hypothetical protein Glove_320g90 [Diversispora epigaea]|uniref:DUF659 domain-containing protein n=1 Tax=Diversispora epigaea TaxID=1348612 RepID=A0A397HNT4_9GLOM|nr:hypothetical protein Glove_320g90 [Diversispora epigaea]
MKLLKILMQKDLQVTPCRRESKKGHRWGCCVQCGTYWACAKPIDLEAHLAFNCPDNNKEVIQFYSKVIINRSETSQAVSSDPKLSSKKLQQINYLSDFMESTKLTPERENAINLSILKVFIMCNIPFHIINNSYFINALYELRPAYSPPQQTFSSCILHLEIAKINSKLQNIFEKNENLTLGNNLYFDFMESTKLTPERENAINLSILKVFIMCNIPFHIINNSYFINALYELRPAYSPPQQTFSSCILHLEIAKINSKLQNIFEKNENLTLDEIPQKFKINFGNMYNLSHISQLLKEFIQEILDEIGNEKFSTIVTDNGFNCNAVYILKHHFANHILRRCSILVNFFNTSHQLHDLLIHTISEKGIIGGELKKCVKTRWTSTYECISSVYHLKICIKEILENNS